ncbi:unnamed protein product [Arctogadus glacialis]
MRSSLHHLGLCLKQPDVLRLDEEWPHNPMQSGPQCAGPSPRFKALPRANTEKSSESAAGELGWTAAGIAWRNGRWQSSVWNGPARHSSAGGAAGQSRGLDGSLQAVGWTGSWQSRVLDWQSGGVYEPLPQPPACPLMSPAEVTLPSTVLIGPSSRTTAQLPGIPQNTRGSQ